MSEEKQIEQAIGWHKVVFAILSAIDISLLRLVCAALREREPGITVCMRYRHYFSNSDNCDHQQTCD